MIADEHWALWHRDPRATPFQSPAWLDAWWRHLGGGERLDAVVRDGAGTPVAALPLFVWQDGDTRRLVPVGAGHSDYCDALLAPGADMAALWQAILATADRWDELLLPDLRPDSPLLGPVPHGWAATDEPGEVCPVLTLPEAGPLLPALTKTQRRKVVHDRHRAARLGGVTEELVASHPDAITEALDALFALHAERWQAEGQAGVLADSHIQSFHRDVAPALAAAGLLRLSLVRHHGRIAAVLYGFADATRGYSYINGVAFVPGQSFGTMAFACLIEAAAEGGAREFHFLRGEETYKYGWGAQPTHTIRRAIRRAR